MVQYGAYDPIYPNRIVTVAGDQEIFEIRFLVADEQDHHLIREKEFPFHTVRIHSTKA